MASELIAALRKVYEDETLVPPPASGPKRSTNFEKLRRLRLVWDRREDKSLPFNFGFVLEGKMAGMALPTSQDQLLKIAKEHSVGMSNKFYYLRPKSLAPDPVSPSTGLICSMIEEENVPFDHFLQFSEDQGAESLQNIHVDWRDRSTPERRHIEAMLVKVKEYMDQNPSKSVVFHCYAGKGRTGTAIAAFLIKYHGMTGIESINYVRKFRKGSIETREQERWLVDYYNSLNPGKEPEPYL